MQRLDYPVINADTYSFPSKFLLEILWLVQKVSENKITNWHEIQTKLRIAVNQEMPELLTLARQIAQILNSKDGFVVVKGLPFHLYKRPIADYLYLSLAAHLGQFTIHSNAQGVIWDVTPRHFLHQRQPTFSELNAEAPLHIDSAFRHKPEEYFGLFTINSAKEGGKSIIIKSDGLIQSLRRSSLGEECLKILCQQNFPFQVPPAFVKKNESKVILAPIVAETPLIRFRLDTIEAGFKCCPELATPERLWALDYFNKFSQSYQNRIELKLTDGDIIFVNNHRVLHGRTAFSNNDRLLLRVRIDQNPQDMSEETCANEKIPVAL